MTRKEIERKALMEFLLSLVPEIGFKEKYDGFSYLKDLAIIQMIGVGAALGAPIVFRYAKYEDLEYFKTQVKEGSKVKFQFLYTDFKETWIMIGANQLPSSVMRGGEGIGGDGK